MDGMGCLKQACADRPYNTGWPFSKTRVPRETDKVDHFVWLANICGWLLHRCKKSIGIAHLTSPQLGEQLWRPALHGIHLHVADITRTERSATKRRLEAASWVGALERRQNGSSTKKTHEDGKAAPLPTATSMMCRVDGAEWSRKMHRYTEEAE